MKFSALLTILSLTLLASCGGGGGGSKGGSSSSPISGSGIGNADSEVYTGDCRYDSGMDKYIRNTVTITKTDGEQLVTLSDDLYADSDCKNVKLSIDYPVFNITEPDETTIEGDTHGVSFRPRSKDIVREMNKEAVCGFTNWKLNRAQDLSNTSCASSLDGKISIALRGQSLTLNLCPSNQRSCAQLILQKK